MIRTQLWSSRGAKQKTIGQASLGSLVVFEVALGINPIVTLAKQLLG